MRAGLGHGIRWINASQFLLFSIFGRLSTGASITCTRQMCECVGSGDMVVMDDSGRTPPALHCLVFLRNGKMDGPD